MSKQTTDQKTEKQTEVKQPVALNDDELGGIAGGPHFRTWDNIYYDYHGGADLSRSDGK